MKHKMKRVDCPDCYGNGFIVNRGEPYGCPRCNGTGIYASRKWLLVVAFVFCVVGFVGFAWSLM